MEIKYYRRTPLRHRFRSCLDSCSFFFGIPFRRFRTPVQSASDSSPIGLGLQSSRSRTVANQVWPGILPSDQVFVCIEFEALVSPCLSQGFSYRFLFRGTQQAVASSAFIERCTSKQAEQFVLERNVLPWEHLLLHAHKPLGKPLGFVGAEKVAIPRLVYYGRIVCRKGLLFLWQELPGDVVKTGFP